jgi:hypothetical protein
VNVQLLPMFFRTMAFGKSYAEFFDALWQRLMVTGTNFSSQLFAVTLPHFWDSSKIPDQTFQVIALPDH